MHRISVSTKTRDALLPHQIRALERILRRVSGKRSGLVYHTARARAAETVAYLLHEVATQHMFPKVLVLTPRLEAEYQIHNELLRSQELLLHNLTLARSSEDLRSFIETDSRGIMFSSLQKLSRLSSDDTVPRLSSDDTVPLEGTEELLVIAYDAHRYSGGRVIFQLLQLFRDATLLGFSSGPSDGLHVLIEIWGELIDVYTFHHAVEDGLALPICYEQASGFEPSNELSDDDFFAGLDGFAEMRPQHLRRTQDYMQRVVHDIVSRTPPTSASKAVLIVDYLQLAQRYHELFQEEQFETGVYSTKEPEVLQRLQDPKSSLQMMIVTNRFVDYGSPCVDRLFLDTQLSSSTLINGIEQISEPSPNKESALLIDYRDHSSLLQQTLEAIRLEEEPEQQYPDLSGAEVFRGLRAEDQKREQWSARRLAKHVANVLQGTILHQRPRWGPLLGHKSQYEGWWKAEFALALENWCWQFNLPYFWCKTEPQPRDVGIGDQKSKKSTDLVVAPGSSSGIDINAGPRVWVEIKERGTWWQGNVNKGLGTANDGLLKELSKWKDQSFQDFDAVLACHIVTHDGTNDEHLPRGWLEKLEEIAERHERLMEPHIVGFPLSEKAVRWARMDLFVIHMGNK